MSNEQVLKITEKLHLLRNIGAGVDGTLALNDAMRGATPDVLAEALLHYSSDLNRGAQDVLRLQMDASIVDQVMSERGENGGQLN